MNPFKIPELLHEIASRVEDPSDKARLAQTDRLTHTITTPYLFRDIEIRLRSVAALAASLKRRPELVAGCLSLAFRSSDESDGTEAGSEPSDQAPPYQDLITIFDVISQNGRLRKLRFNDWGRANFSEDVWAAICGVSGHLEELHILVNKGEEHAWRRLTQARFPRLKSFLGALSELEHLSLDFPDLFGPRNLTLGSTHPHLKSFAFRSASCVHTGSDFLQRHSTLQRLYLYTRQPFTTSDTSLRGLRAVNVDRFGLYASPTLLSNRQITHLRLNCMDFSGPQAPGSTEPLLLAVVREVSQTLRCLELDGDDATNSNGEVGDFDVILAGVISLLRLAPFLEELGLLRAAFSPPLPTWTYHHLRNLLDAFDDTVQLRALRFDDRSGTGELLHPEFLADLGPLPPRLEYIGWDVTAKPAVYLIERGEGGNSARLLRSRPFQRRRTPDDWTSESVLEHTR
ncbi:hypothetical protein B0H19DRAFT_1249321 [Mycena capillaripes]|nr:hypothetical protein B0H19DRAFT_1249321 [Mycena capillaripes]